jgi:ABC-2 type transport system ATP-binding protein
MSTTPHPRAPVIAVRGLVKRYGSLEAVAGIDLDVTPGEIFGFLGPNGAGKTTTIQILCTLLRATEGSATVAGFDVTAQPDAVRACIGLVFQDPSLDEQLSARENLEFHAMIYDVPRSVRKRRIDAVLEMVDLHERQTAMVRTFSGGMKRRLEIARGILHAPQVLFLDEPTQGLDPQTRAHIWRYLNELRRSEDITIFMTTHYMDEAEYCERIAIIDHGHIVAQGSPDQLKEMVGGDVVTASTGDDAAAAAELLAKLGVNATVAEGGVHVEVGDGAAFVPRMISALTVPVNTVTIRRPSLDDVFLKLTGRAIRDSEAGGVDQLRAMAQMFRGRR